MFSMKLVHAFVASSCVFIQLAVVHSMRKTEEIAVTRDCESENKGGVLSFHFQDHNKSFSNRSENSRRSRIRNDAAGEFLATLIVIGIILCCLFVCYCFGYCRARRLRARLETLQFKYPKASAERQPVSTISDGLLRLAQEKRIMIKQDVNAAQELSGALLNYSIQTANVFHVFSASDGKEGDEKLLSCREVQDMAALLGMNLGGALGAAGIEAGKAHAGRDKAPFRIAVGLPPESTNLLQVQVPPNVVPGQQIMVPAPDGRQVTVSVPAGAPPGSVFNVQLLTPSAMPQQDAGGAQQILQGMFPGFQPNNDRPCLYLERPVALDCYCFCRPYVDVYDVRNGVKVKLGIISDPWHCLDMTFHIHVGPNATEESWPTLIVRGAGCQPGADCDCCCGCCGRTCREAYLEVINPKKDDKTVAFITKGWAGAGKETFTNANNYYVDFGEIKDPSCKALLLATTLFVNYRFFEGTSGTQHDRSFWED
eukprot:TRINITY_DN1960_c1_g2_i1.p1 TRINITY_DN1960_c1_g2~~TRINITY_DN1960_c1_g2_i1.p1  ORF type:complete len:482 (-),score=63.49 TRINITY_DN1960_c1_g2_i1:231-1676(-)